MVEIIAARTTKNTFFGRLSFDISASKLCIYWLFFIKNVTFLDF